MTATRHRLAMLPLRALLLGSAAVVASGCSPAPGDTFAITFQNDTGQAVVLNLCDDSNCRNFDYSNKLRPGESVPENVSTDNVFTRWAVNDGSGRRLGCLPFSFAGAYSNAAARLSQMVPCPGSRALQLAEGTRERS